MLDSFDLTPDGFPSIFLERLAVPLDLRLCILCNESLKSGIVPSIWKNASVFPIYKSGSKSVFDNYRPIDLTSNLCRISEKLVPTEITDDYD